MAFFHFKQGRLKAINFDLIRCNDLDLQRVMIRESVTGESTTCH
jgi:hypothetical protein